MSKILLTQIFYICFTIYAAQRSYNHRHKSKLTRAKWLFAFLAGVTATIAAFDLLHYMGLSSSILLLIALLLSMIDSHEE